MVGGREADEGEGDGRREDQVAGEVGELGGEPDAEVVHQRLQAGDHDEEDHLVRQRVSWQAPKAPKKNVQVPTLMAPSTVMRPSRLSQAVSQPVNRFPRIEPQ